jgi:hypothetical protein
MMAVAYRSRDSWKGWCCRYCGIFWVVVVFVVARVAVVDKTPGHVRGPWRWGFVGCVGVMVGRVAGVDDDVVCGLPSQADPRDGHGEGWKVIDGERPSQSSCRSMDPTSCICKSL